MHCSAPRVCAWPDRDWVSGTKACCASARGIAYKAWRCARCPPASSGKRSHVNQMTTTFSFSQITRTRTSSQFNSRFYVCVVVCCHLSFPSAEAAPIAIEAVRCAHHTRHKQHSRVLNALHRGCASLLHLELLLDMCAQTIL